MSEELFKVIELEERPAVLVKLNEHDMVIELKKERGVKLSLIHI